MLIVGILVVAFPVYVTLVASTHTSDDLVGKVPLWFGDRFLENYRTILSTRHAGGRTDPGAS